MCHLADMLYSLKYRYHAVVSNVFGSAVQHISVVNENSDWYEEGDDSPYVVSEDGDGVVWMMDYNDTILMLCHDKNMTCLYRSTLLRREVKRICLVAKYLQEETRK